MAVGAIDNCWYGLRYTSHLHIRMKDPRPLHDDEEGRIAGHDGDVAVGPGGTSRRAGARVNGRSDALHEDVGCQALACCYGVGCLQKRAGHGQHQES